MKWVINMTDEFEKLGQITFSTQLRTEKTGLLKPLFERLSLRLSLPNWL